MKPEWKWDDPPQDMGRRLRAAREYGGISVTRMAELMGCNRATIRNWESERFPRNRLRLQGVIDGYMRHARIMPWWFEKADIKLSDLFDEILPAKGTEEDLAALEDEA